MSERSPQEVFQSVIAGLRLEFRDAYRNGLGVENPPAREIEEILEESMKEIMALHAKATMAGALGLTPWLICEMTQTWPDTLLGGD